jgi:hypothetical protein
MGKTEIRETVMYKPRDIQEPNRTSIAVSITRQGKAKRASLGEKNAKRKGRFPITIINTPEQV